MALVAGYLWLYHAASTPESDTTVCLFKNITTLPCPSCGATRSVICVLNGNIEEALFINPLGILILLIMVVSPFWIVFDLLTGRITLYHFYCKIEQFLRKPIVAVPLIVLVIVNWLWNISKGL
jgi:hypothetical protein